MWGKIEFGGVEWEGEAYLPLIPRIEDSEEYKIRVLGEFPSGHPPPKEPLVIMDEAPQLPRELFAPEGEEAPSSAPKANVDEDAPDPAVQLELDIEAHGLDMETAVEDLKARVTADPADRELLERLTGGDKSRVKEVKDDWRDGTPAEKDKCWPKPPTDLGVGDDRFTITPRSQHGSPCRTSMWTSARLCRCASTAGTSYPSALTLLLA